MRVLVHSVAMRKQGGGSRHLQGLLTALAELDDKHEYYLYLDSRFPMQARVPRGEVRRVRPSSQLHRFWWDQVEMPRIARRDRVDLILALLVFGSFAPPVPQISFQENALPFCREYLGKLRKTSREYVDLRLRKEMAYRTMRGSRLTIVPSVALQRLIVSHYPSMARRRIEVLPHAVELEQFRRDSDTSGLGALTAAHQVDVPRLLYVSHLEPHKGFEIMLDALEVLAQRGVAYQLLTTLDPRDGEVYFRRLQQRIGANVSERIINLGRVPEQQVHHLYAAADLFLFPSLCESFGFPMKEALAMCLPIVAADTPINREICGPGATYYAPFDAPAMAAEVERLLLSRPVRDQVRAAGTNYFERSTLTWRDYARSLLVFMQETAERR